VLCHFGLLASSFTVMDSSFPLGGAFKENCGISRRSRKTLRFIAIPSKQSMSYLHAIRDVWSTGFASNTCLLGSRSLIEEARQAGFQWSVI